MERKLKYLFVRLLALLITQQIYAVSWTMFFIYLEECLPQSKTDAISENGEDFRDFVYEMKHLTDEQKMRILNVTAEFFMERESHHCSYGRENFVKWWEFVLVSLSTVGFGHLVPKTQYGKMCIICCCSLGIPLTMALFAVAGEIITNIIDGLLKKVEVGCLGKRKVKKMPQKRFMATMLLSFLSIIIGGFLVRYLTRGKWTLIDGTYYTFQVLTTIGYGDMYLKEAEIGITVFVFIVMTASFGMGVTASLISSVTTLIQTAKAGDRIKRVSIARATWKIPKIKNDGEGAWSRGKFTQYGFQQENPLEKNI